MCAGLLSAGFVSMCYRTVKAASLPLLKSGMFVGSPPNLPVV